MSQCRLCRKAIKWIQVPGPTGLLVWRAFDKRRRAGTPYQPHQCEKLKGPGPIEPAERPRPWWLDDD